MPHPIYLDDNRHDDGPSDAELAGEVDVWERIQAAIADRIACPCNAAASPCAECRRVFGARDAFLRTELTLSAAPSPVLTPNRIQGELVYLLPGATAPAIPRATRTRRENH
jgi:hypothetical protein